MTFGLNLSDAQKQHKKKKCAHHMLLVFMFKASSTVDAHKFSAATSLELTGLFLSSVKTDHLLY